VKPAREDHRSVEAGYEPAINGWGPKAWLAGAPVLTMLLGVFFGYPRAVVVGGALFAVQGLWMVVTGLGVSHRALVSGRQAGVGVFALGLAGVGYGQTYLAQDERWLRLAFPLAGVAAIFAITLWSSEEVRMGRSRWLMTLSGVMGCATVVAGALGHLT